MVISMMKEAGIHRLVVASTGNVAISYSAYSAHAGIKLWTFLPSLVPPEKMREIAIYGSEVVKVTATYDITKKVASQFAEHRGILADRGIRSIGTRESMKTIAMEVAEQLAAELAHPNSPGARPVHPGRQRRYGANRLLKRLGNSIRWAWSTVCPNWR